MTETKAPKKTKAQIPEWFKLDNAASVFPGQNTSTWSNIFRFSIELKEEINPEILKAALERILPRFPEFDVRIRRGLFWYYFEKNPNGAPPVEPDVVNPCHRVKFKENRGYLFRIYYYENRISCDFYHALTDGMGASVFVCTLAAEYLRLCGLDISNGGHVLDIAVPAKQSELDDPYLKCGKSKGKVSRKLQRVYHAGGTKIPAHTVNVTRGIIPLDEIRSLAEETQKLTDKMGTFVAGIKSASEKTIILLYYSKRGCRIRHNQ